MKPAPLSSTAALEVPVRITGKVVDYSGRDGRATFTGNVVVVRSTSTLWADALETLRGSAEAIASGHVLFMDAERKMVLTCDRLRYANGLREIFAAGACRMVSGGPPDETTVTGDEMQVNVETREAVARGAAVVIHQGTSEAVCREARLFGAEDRAVLTGRPILRRPPHEFECDEVTTWFKEGRSLLRGNVKGKLVPEKMDDLKGAAGAS